MICFHRVLGVSSKDVLLHTIFLQHYSGTGKKELSNQFRFDKYFLQVLFGINTYSRSSFHKKQTIQMAQDGDFVKYVLQKIKEKKIA